MVFSNIIYTLAFTAGALDRMKKWGGGYKVERLFEELKLLLKEKKKDEEVEIDRKIKYASMANFNRNRNKKVENVVLFCFANPLKDKKSSGKSNQHGRR